MAFLFLLVSVASYAGDASKGETIVKDTKQCGMCHGKLPNAPKLDDTSKFTAKDKKALKAYLVDGKPGGAQNKPHMKKISADEFQHVYAYLFKETGGKKEGKKEDKKK